MPRWIALLRGVNVGGKNRLPMAELQRELEQLGMKNVQTYFQSGNIVFDSASKKSAALAKQIADSVQKNQGFAPDVLLLQKEQLAKAVQSNPFPKAISDPKSLHFYFMANSTKSPDMDAIEESKSPTESYKLVGNVFYLHAPDGVGRSKLAAKAEKFLGVRTTARNYQTVDQLVQMANQG